MAKKKNMPFWLSALLAMLLGTLVVLIVVAPQHETTNDKATAASKQQAKQITTAQRDPFQQKQIEHKSTPKTHQRIEPVAPEARQKSTATAPSMLPTGHGIALVIDDVGYDLMALKRILKLSVPVAISVLPDAPFAHQAAALSQQAGQVVMLHLPMQPQDPSLQMGDDFLRANMDQHAIRQTFLRDLKKVPYAEGTNNHMGSKLTQLDSPMQWVMQLCREQGLFFLDSKTSSHSVAAKVARDSGIAWASRRIFLDHEMTLEAMQQAWQQARNCAAKQRSCIVIAHPRAKTVAFLENYLTKADAKNMVSIKQLLHPNTGANTALMSQNNTP